MRNKITAVLIAAMLLGTGLCFAQNPVEEKNPYSFLKKDSGLFPVSDALKDQTAFWIDIFTRHNVNTLVYHNYEDPRIVYRIVDITKELGKDDPSRKEKERLIKKHRKEIKNQLRNIYKNSRSPGKLSSDERNILKDFKKYKAEKLLAKAANKIRIQDGMREKFRKSLERSGKYLENIVRILRDESVPVEYSVLPHIESEYNYVSYSKYGAAGIWQFTRSTGRKYMAINNVIDERRDPIRSTYAVAKLFRDNYKRLNNWPLVVISHNHGVNGMRRAKNQLNTVDPAVIIKKYRSRIFGFASKNFYPEFLAALEICRNWKKYFGQINFQEPVRYKLYKLPQYTSVEPLLKSFKISKKVFAGYNPSIRPAVYRNEYYIPRNFTIRLPASSGNPETLYAAIPGKYKLTRQKLLKRYKVKYGEYLSGIAKKLRVSVGNLMAVNKIKNPNKIRAGMMLKVPQAGQHYVPKINYKKRIALENRQVRTAKGDDGNSINSVNESLKIIVLEDEFLDKYAEWAGISTKSIKQYNNISRKNNISIGQIIYIPVNRDKHELFLEKRKNFQDDIQNDFFARYKVKDVSKYKIKPNDNLWTLCCIKFEIPVWLLVKYNEKLMSRPLYKGETIIIPNITVTNGEQ